MPVHIGVDSLKKPHHIITLRFSEVVKDHANYHGTNSIHTIIIALFFLFQIYCIDDRLLHKKEGFLVVVMPGGNLVGNSGLKFPTLLGTSQPKNFIEVPVTY